MIELPLHRKLMVQSLEELMFGKPVKSKRTLAKAKKEVEVFYKKTN
jgi:hypothetical protein